MRVIGGKEKGRRLASFKSPSIRPTSDKARESIFNVLGQNLLGFEKTLDLFSGTGAMGIEALSRGSKEAVFIDKDPEAIAITRKNLKLCGFLTNFRVFKDDVLTAIRKLGRGKERFDLIFVDAPYTEVMVTNDVLREILQNGILNPEGMTICEVGKRFTNRFKKPAGFKVEKEKRYGDTVIYFLTRGETCQDA